MRIGGRVALGAVLGICAVYLLARGRAAAAAQSAGQAVGGAVGGAVVGVAEGVVYGVGDAIGLPRTDVPACENAVQEGRWWDASFDCAAGDFIAAGWGKLWGND